MNIQEIRPPISLWDTSSREQANYQNGLEESAVDVAIVGGGFTGLSTALHASQNGLSCQVLEAHHIGFGGSGRNVGLVNAGLWIPPQDVRARLGDVRGGELVQALGDAPSYVFSLIEKHAIECEATRSGTIHAAHSLAGFEDLRRRSQEWQRLGAPVDLLSRAQAAERIGSHRFFGALVDRRAGTINPMAYVRGLARAATAAGAKIATGVTVQKLRQDRKKWIVETDKGPISARSVVLGTNAYTDALWPGLSRTFTKIHYFQLATVPLGDRAASILPQRQGLWDTGSIMFSLRRDAYGRILIGSMGTVIGGTGGLSSRWAASTLKRLFPKLGPVEFETAWHGQIAMTPDHLPRIYRLADGLYTPIGYNGRGITPGTIFGRAMGDLLAGGDERKLPLPITDLKTVASAPIMSHMYQAAFSMNQAWKSVWQGATT